jgi:hypothetical protein
VVRLLPMVTPGTEVGMRRNHLVLFHVLEDDAFIFSLSLVSIIRHAIYAS